MDWDDFRLVQAIAEHKGLAGAAERLGFNPSTTFRRLAAVEAKLGAALFERHRSGYVPTAAGVVMIVVAGRMGEDVVRFERALAGQEQNPVGGCASRHPQTSSCTFSCRFLGASAHAIHASDWIS